MTLHLGKHILVELYGCDRDLLNDAKKLIGLSLEAVVASGEEWNELLTEEFDGRAFGPFTAQEAADIIRSDEDAVSYVDIE